MTQVGQDRYTAGRLSTEMGIDHRRMRQILTLVNPVETRGNRKYYLLRDVIPFALNYISGPDVINLNEERAKKMAAEAALAEMEVAEKRQSLIAIEEVIDSWGDIVNAVKGKLTSLPAKLAPVVAVENNPAICKGLIEEQINEALNELAEWIKADLLANEEDYDGDVEGSPSSSDIEGE
jgi:hypothetical protein